MKKIFIIVLVTMGLSVNAFGSCLPAYQDKVKRAGRLIIPTRGATYNNLAGQLVAQPMLLALGAFNPIALATSLSILAGTGTIYLISSLRTKAFANVIELYVQAGKGDGHLLRKIQRKAMKKQGQNIPLTEIAPLIIDGMENEKFCQFDYKRGRHKVLSFRKVKKLITNYEFNL